MEITVRLEQCKSVYILRPSLSACRRRARNLSETTLAFLLEGKLYQVDYDFVELARSLGKPWPGNRKGTCPHHGTDGTVKCPDCGKTAMEFIAEAQAWLDKRAGDTFRVSARVLGWDD